MRVRLRGLWWRLCDVLAGRTPRCDHGFAPDRGIGLWCPGCEAERLELRPPGFYTTMDPECADLHYGFPYPPTDKEHHIASDGSEWVFNNLGGDEWDAVSDPDDDLRRTMTAAAQAQGEQAARKFVEAVERGELRHLDEGQQ